MSHANFNVLRVLLALAILASLLGCSTANGVGPDIEIEIQQFAESEFVVESRGAVSTAYLLVVRNRSDTPITLTRLDMQTTDRSPYLLRDEPVTLDETIEPGGEATVSFSMWAIPRDKGTSASQAVWVAGTLRFESNAVSHAQKFTIAIKQVEG